MWYHGWGGWWFLMPLAMIAFWGGLLWIVFAVTRRPAGPLPDGSGPDTDAERILDARYARLEGLIEEHDHSQCRERSSNDSLEDHHRRVELGDHR